MVRPIPREAWSARPPRRRAPVLHAEMAVVHHTTGRNDYGRDSVPALLREIQDLHMDENGWDDIGYNLVVDCFGRAFGARDGVGAPNLGSGHMTIQRMDNVLIVVDELEAAKAFFAEIGMELEGETTVEGGWVDRVVGLSDVRADIVMMRVPDGHGRVELTKFHRPPAVRAEPESAPVNALGIRRIMFAVDDVDDVVARLRSHGAELVGEIAQYEDMYRLCYVRGPEGIIVGLAEQLG